VYVLHLCVHALRAHTHVHAQIPHITDMIRSTQTVRKAEIHKGKTVAA